MDPRTRAAVDWLLTGEEPGIRGQTRRDLLGEPPDEDVMKGRKVQALLAPGLGRDPYQKWSGAHWRLVSLAELGAPPGEPHVVAIADYVLSWLTNGGRGVRVIGGLPRQHASIEGNALAAVCRLGLAADPRAGLLAGWLVSWQWPDGGWNCDERAGGHRSSFHETLPPMWGLHEYARATGDEPAATAAGRAAELLLEHRLFRSLATGEVIHRAWLAPHYPPYWHYDILQALLVLSRMGRAADPRAADALDELERRRLRDGRWRSGGHWFNPPDRPYMHDPADWGRSGPNEMVTLNALRVLRAAGRL
ncbi:hypothetical protein SAMN05444920_11276 [Nonomuraea solani]|uniref:Prenyltransferase and squalene oxidase repeat-containing protein n=1 Tax=Nonomuraea solani TaxID=1144553 RepID=A0A1H6EPB4_9ACTN|nr:hypothetical protein [Nonomuraea solani]SEG98856.1 hypothetical protein SAMN05444920_11276 [Nonomuraea solani]